MVWIEEKVRKMVGRKPPKKRTPNQTPENHAKEQKTNYNTKTQEHKRKEPEENEGTSSKGNGTISVPCDGTIGERRKKG